MKSVIDMSLEEFCKKCEKSTYRELVMMKRYLEVEYNRVEATKNLLLKGIKEGTFTGKDKIEAEDLVVEMYKILQRIEDRAIVVEKFKDLKKVKFD